MTGHRSLNPGRYVGVAERAADDFEFAERLEELNEELETLNSEARELETGAQRRSRRSALFQAFRCPASPERPEAVKSAVLEFVRRLDSLVELLAQTADSLAAEWDLRSDPPVFDADWPGGKPTIQ